MFRRRASTWSAVAALLVLCALATSGFARPRYLMEFNALYMDEGTALHKALDGKATCSVCHWGKGKRIRSPYGRAVYEALGRQRDVRDKDKIVGALRKAEQARSVPGDPESPTFGQLIESGTLAGYGP